MDKTTAKALSFLAGVALDSRCITVREVNTLMEMIDGNFSAFEESGSMTAWEPIPEKLEGTCGTCRHLDTRTCFTTYPPKYACSLTGKLRFESSECDVPYAAVAAGEAK